MIGTAAFLLANLPVLLAGWWLAFDGPGEGVGSHAGSLPGRRIPGAPAVALAWGLGLAVVVPATVAAGLLGWPLRPWSVGLLLVGMAGAARLAGASPSRWRGGWTTGGGRILPPPVTGGGEGSRWQEPWRWTARAVLGLAVAVLLWKLAVAPLWAWDHFAMWGLKARRLAAAGELDFAFLNDPRLLRTKSDVPVGLPVAWIVSALGGVPGAATFKLVHAAFALGLLAVVRDAAARLAASRPVGDLAAAFVALSPLLWDSVHLGLADLPLAFFATASLAALLASLQGEGEGGPGLRLTVVAGGLAGFVPWIKDEGLPLALLLVVVAGAWTVAPPWPRRDGGDGRGRRFLAYALPVGVGVTAMALVDRLALPEGLKLLSGDWTGRLLRRLGERGGEILLAVGRELVGPEWLGLWLLLPVAVGVALLPRVRRSRPALLRRVLPPALLVGLQGGLYVLVILAAYPEPLDQVESGLSRIVAPLLPLAVLALAALAGRGVAAIESPGTESRQDAAMDDKTPTSGPFAYVRDFASRLRYPQLFFLAAGLFLADLLIPDLIPFADEILLGLLTLLLGRIKDRRRGEGPDAREPRVKNVTPED